MHHQVSGNNDLFRFSPIVQDSGEDNSDQDNLMLGHEIGTDEDEISSDEHMSCHMPVVWTVITFQRTRIVTSLQK